MIRRECNRIQAGTRSTRLSRAFKRLSSSAGMCVVLAAMMLIWGCSALKPRPRDTSASKPRPSTVRKPKPYKIANKWYQPLAHADGFRQRGFASWYGKKFHGRKTANGETYNMYAMTAAHKTLPLGTRVKVRNLKNGKEIEVRVNDRGPFVRGRIIDLSYKAAGKLGVVGPGTAPVEIYALGKGGKVKKTVDYSRGNFTVQVGAFTRHENAKRYRNKLSRSYENAHISRYDSGFETFYRVRIGRFSRLDQAERFERSLIEDGFAQAITVAE